MIPWTELCRRYHDEDTAKVTVEEIQAYPRIERESNKYLIDPKGWKKLRLVQ
jgi:hypothetical protein